MPLFEWLEKLDKIAFILIHRDSDARVLDLVLPLARHPLTWIPLYCLLFYFIFSGYKHKAWPFIILSILTVIITDQLSASLFKPLFERPRPCFDAELQPFIRNLVDCGGRFSFPSSHAANHVGLASFWYWSIKDLTGKKWKWLWLWALLICYAQIYVGKHYPLDILAGSLLGCLAGMAMVKVFEQWHFMRKTIIQHLDHTRPAKS